MKVYLLQDIERVGMSGEVIKVTDGFFRNFLEPRKLAIQLTKANESFFAQRARKIDKRERVVDSKTSMLAQKIADAKLIFKARAHDDGKLYGSIGPADVAGLLAKQGIAVAKSQVHVKKSIKECGKHTITIKLSSRLQPTCTITVIPK